MLNERSIPERPHVALFDSIYKVLKKSNLYSRKQSELVWAWGWERGLTVNGHQELRESGKFLNPS